MLEPACTAHGFSPTLPSSPALPRPPRGADYHFAIPGLVSRLGASASQADKFHKTGKQLRSKMWWQNMRMKIVVVIAVLVLILVIFLLVSWHNRHQSIPSLQSYRVLGEHSLPAFENLVRENL